jgi:hypothetical protein
MDVHTSPTDVTPTDATPTDATATETGSVPGQKRNFLARLARRIWISPSWLAPLAVLFCAVSAIGYVLTNDPTDTTRDPVGPCVFRAVTGYDCPGCGGTRMVWYALHGNFPEAARHHLVAFALIPVVIYGYLAWAGNRLFGTRIPWKPGGKFWLIVIVSWASFAILRNLPFAPFDHFWV